MKRIFTTFICFLVCAVSDSQTLTEKLDAYFLAAQKTGIFNGTVLVTRGTNTLLNKGYGFKNVEGKSSNDANTIFQIGSVTKQFTSAVILKLQEQTKLSINDKLSKYFPRLRYADSITIENLLSHTSGIYNYTNDADFMENEVEKPLSQDKFLLLIKNKPLSFTPGTRFSYSNSGYMFLGYIIEKVTGKKYEHVVREMIFTPLQMNSSGFDFTHLRSNDKAIGYDGITDGKGIKSMIVDSTVSFAAGAVYSTTGDIYKWNQSLLTDKILSRSSIENAFTPRQSKYGLGWGVDSIDGKVMITHNGGIHGFLSHNTIIPNDSLTITILSNSGSTKVGQVHNDVLAILYSKPYTIPQVQKEIKVDALILRQYVGEYELTPAFKITVTVDGGLKAQATGQPSFDLFAKSETRFFVKVVDAEIEFVKNDKGEVEKLILYQAGQQIPGKKIK